MNININSTQISALLQLYPMVIPGAVENLKPQGVYHYGIPEILHSPSTKLFMVIDPVTLFSTPFAAGDSVKVWVNSQPTSAVKNIYPGEENDRIFLELLWGELKDGLNRMYYEVTRVSGNKDQSTPILNVLFNNPVSTIKVNHPPSIGPGQTPDITITVSDARPYDTVILTIGTWSITFNNPDPTKPITHTLTAAELQLIKDGTRLVFARVFDQLFNSGVSPTTSIDIRANQAPLAIDQSSMVLNGPKIIQGYGWLTKKVVGNTATRTATGGVQPYSYVSSNPVVATVTASGEVSGVKNGPAIIEVTDALGVKVSYPVNVSNVIQVYVNDALLTCEQAYKWATSVGATMNTAYPLLSDALQSNLVDVRQAFFNSIGEPGRRWGYLIAHASFPGNNFFGWWEANDSTVISGAGHPVVPGQFPDPSFKAKAIAYVQT